MASSFESIISVDDIIVNSMIINRKMSNPKKWILLYLILVLQIQILFNIIFVIFSLKTKVSFLIISAEEYKF